MDSILTVCGILSSRPAIASLLGLLAHRYVFIHGEWHLQAPTVFCVHVLFAFAIVGAEMQCEGIGYKASTNALLSITCYLTSLFGSIAIYRLYFHQTRHFPGPRLWAVSKLWHVWQCRDSRNHLVLEKLHQEYGPFVRTGPNEITIFSSGAFEAMDGPKSNTTRSDWYDLIYPRRSSVFTRDKALHSQRKQLWIHALSSHALKSYEPRVIRKIASLNNHIGKSTGKRILVNDLLQWFAFDLMGDFAFSEDFGMMENLEYNNAIKMLRSSLALLGPFGQAIWVPRLGFAFMPGLWKVRDWFGMLKFGDDCMNRRLKTQVKERDIASYFIEDWEKNKDVRESDKWLNGDTATVITAGSDTVSSSLTTILYFIAKYPQDAQIIYKELSKIDVHDIQAVASLDHLNGVINESMRLLPAFLTVTTRMTPPEGMEIDGTFIPGNVKIAAPRYSISRLESAWKEPLNFCPERWYSKPEMIIDKRAFAPFGVGRTMCVGKNLALTEIRMAIASLIYSFRISFGPGDDGEAVERDMRDQLTSNPGALNLVFERR